MTVTLSVLGAAAVLSIITLGIQHARSTLRSGDTEERSFASALARCLSEPTYGERVACVQPILDRAMETQGIQLVLAHLEALQGERPEFRTYCHEMAHLLGRSWIARGRGLGEGFTAGTGTCHSGFFHGMVERVFLGDGGPGADLTHVARDVVEERVPTICTPERLGTASRNIRFQCFHGLGHTLQFTLGYDLSAALQTCDLLSESWDQHSCYGGVFMENITGAEVDRRMLRAGDPHYPCSAVAEIFRDDCYLMQTSWMLEQGMTWEAIREACRGAGASHLSCFQSLGRDLSAWVRRDGISTYPAICEDLPPDERTACIHGAVYALADHTWDGTYAYPFCVAFADVAVRGKCFRAAQRHLLESLERPIERVTADCVGLTSLTEECLAALRSR